MADKTDKTETVTGYTVEQIKKLAYLGEVLPPPSVPQPERILWYSYRDLYQRFRQKKVSREESEKESASIMEAYRIDRSVFDSALMTAHHHAELWKNIEAAGNRFARDQTIENAILFHDAVYGVRMKQRQQSPDTGEEENAVQSAAEGAEGSVDS